MKKVLSLIAVLAIVLVFAACDAATAPSTVPTAAAAASVQPSPSAAEVVVFTDEVLEGLVRKALNKPSGDISVAEAEAVKNLDLKENEPSSSKPRIKDISALKYFKNLTFLDISFQKIEDLSPLAGMTKLECLVVWGAESIKDFSALKNMTNMLDLTICDMNGNPFKNSDMQYLAGMTNIEMIWIQGAKELTDISVVAGFKKLYRLNVDYTGVSDISPAAGCTTLVEVNLSGSKVSDVSPLKGLINLKKLFLKDCPIKDYSPLKDIYKNLEEKDFTLK